MLRVVSAVASPITKLAGAGLPLSQGIDLACLKDVKCGESTLGEIFEGTAVGDAIARIESVPAPASRTDGGEVAASRDGHDSDADEATHPDLQTPETSVELPLLEFVDASINQCEGIVEWATAEAGVDDDEEAEAELGLEATSDSADATAAVQSVDAVKELIALACKQAVPPRETDVGKHNIAGLSKTVVPGGGIRWLSAEGRAIELARDTEPEPELESQSEPEPQASSSGELSESGSWTLPLIVEPNQLVGSQQHVTLTLSSGASIREAQEQLKCAVQVTGSIEIQLPSHHVVQSPHELQPRDDGPCTVQLCRPAARRSRKWRRQLMQCVDDDSIRVNISQGSIVVSISGLPTWAATALASLALGGDSNSKFHVRMHEILSEHFADVPGDLLHVRLGGVEQAVASECAPYTAAEFDPAWYPADEMGQLQLLLRENAGRISKTQLEQYNIGCPRQLAEDRRRRQFLPSTVPMDVNVSQIAAQALGPWLDAIGLGHCAIGMAAAGCSTVADVLAVGITEAELLAHLTTITEIAERWTWLPPRSQRIFRLRAGAAANQQRRHGARRGSQRTTCTSG